LDWFIVLLIVILFNVASTIVMGYRLVKVSRENRELREKLEKQGRQEAKPRRLPRSIDHEILELYSKGYSLREIARQLGVSHTTVHRRVKHIKQALEELHTGMPESLIKKEEAELEA